MSPVHGNVMWTVPSCVTLVFGAVGRKITGSPENHQRPLSDQFLAALPFLLHPVSLCGMSRKLSSLYNIPLIQSNNSVISRSPRTPSFTLIHLAIAPLFPQIFPPPHLNLSLILLSSGPPPVLRLFVMALHRRITPFPQILILLLHHP